LQFQLVAGGAAQAFDLTLLNIGSSRLHCGCKNCGFRFHEAEVALVEIFVVQAVGAICAIAAMS
jgi:hypothetical protein